MSRQLRPTFVVVTFACLAHAQNPPPPALSPPEEYRLRDVVESSFVNLSNFPVRPMAFDDFGNLWAINQHNSTLLRHTGMSFPSTEIALPWGPSAIALWTGVDPIDASDDVMLVACMGSWAVAEISCVSGEILQIHQLRPTAGDSSRQGEMATPGDIVVVGNQALVSCPASDTVLQIDLSVQPRTIFVYGRDTGFAQFKAKSPLFLSKSPDGKVYVAPLISGNNTISEQIQAGATKVIQPSDPTKGLPDNDLFEIDPATHSLNLIGRSMGTILFAHGINPASSPAEMWMLNTEAFNVVQGTVIMNSEPVVNGRFSFDRITSFPLPTSPAVAFQGTATWLNPGTPVSPVVAGMTAPIGQPFSLTFLNSGGNPAHGHAFLCGLLTDNVLVLDKNRNFVKQFSVPDGSIPRQLLLDPTNTKLLVYCWGNNSVRIHDWAAAGAPVGTILRLGYDPTPASLKAGRTLFFDGQHSRFGNLSCASCHVEGGSDLLAWNLSNVPQDDKGPMITQTLIGIERMGPFHWRGERALADFHGAFKGLLGKVDPITQLPADLDPAAFAQLQTYLFSLSNPANPNQARRRVLDDALPTPSAPGGLAITGQDAFNDTQVFAASTTTCASCHQMPTGTGNDIIDEFQGSSQPRRTQMKSTPFHELWRKEMTKEDVDFGTNGGMILQAAFLGAGFSHIGISGDIKRFTEQITSPAIHTPNLTAFVHQWDDGMGQAAHYAFLLDSASSGTATAELQTFLLDQAKGHAGDIQGAASRRNCDIVVFGTVRDINGVSAKRRWFFDRESPNGPDVFRCDDPNFLTSIPGTVGERTLGDFLARAATESNVFLGLPVGMGERFGVDYDFDGTYNALDADSKNPLVPGPVGGAVSFVTSDVAKPAQLLWRTAKVARIRFDTDLPTRYDVYYWPAVTGGTQPVTPQVTTDAYSKSHAFLLTDLRPSTNHAGPFGAYAAKTITYNVLIEARTRNGNLASTQMTVTPEGHKESTQFDINEGPQEQLLSNHVVSSLTMTPITTPTSNPGRSVSITTSYKRGGSFLGNVFRRPRAEHRVIIARVFAQDTQTMDVRPLDRTQLEAVAGSSFLVDDAFLNHSTPANTKLRVGLNPLTGARGVLLVSENPTALVTGVTTMDFGLLTALGANEKVIFSIEGVVHVDLDVFDPNDPTMTPLNVWTGAAMVTGTPPTTELILPTLTQFPIGTGIQDKAWSKWSFPDTKEAGAQVSDP